MWAVLELCIGRGHRSLMLNAAYRSDVCNESPVVCNESPVVVLGIHSPPVNLATAKR